MVKETGYYELMGVSPDAKPEVIRRRYRKAALKCHPDRGGDTSEFQRLQQAYAILYDADKRRIYDEFGEKGFEDGGQYDLSGMEFGARVTKTDIENFCETYRFSDMEQEDLANCFEKCSGSVTSVLEYIPYSDRTDLKRFIDVFSELANKADNDDVKMRWKKAKKTLLKRSRTFKPREKLDYSMENGEDVEGVDGEELGEGDTKDEEQVDISELVASIRAKKKEQKRGFDEMIESLERKAKKRSGSTGRRGRKSSALKRNSEVDVAVEGQAEVEDNETGRKSGKQEKGKRRSKKRKVEVAEENKNAVVETDEPNSKSQPSVMNEKRDDDNKVSPRKKPRGKRRSKKRSLPAGGVGMDS